MPKNYWIQIFFQVTAFGSCGSTLPAFPEICNFNAQLLSTVQCFGLWFIRV